jgi:hypothetical protein
VEPPNRRGILQQTQAMQDQFPNSKTSAWIVAIMLAIVAIPVGITLHTVQVPATILISGSNPTPFGYSWSLLLFIIPILVIGGWFLPGEQVRIPKRAFWRTIWILVPIGFGLDFFFAHRFFEFKNAGATIGLGAPAIGGPVPVEEYVFYFTGFLAVLLLYVWLDEYWLAAYNVQRHGGEVGQMERLLKFHPVSLFVGSALIAAAVLYKKLHSASSDGFPGYLAVLVIGGMVPSASLFHSARRYINWRAFSLTIFMILLISLFWEATLAVPYQWWGYQQKEMVGIFIGAWAGLPIEAVMVWIAVTYGTTIVYEIMKAWQASGRSAKSAFLGRP